MTWRGERARRESAARRTPFLSSGKSVAGKQVWKERKRVRFGPDSWGISLEGLPNIFTLRVAGLSANAQRAARPPGTSALALNKPAMRVINALQRRWQTEVWLIGSLRDKELQERRAPACSYPPSGEPLSLDPPGRAKRLTVFTLRLGGTGARVTHTAESCSTPNIFLFLNNKGRKTSSTSDISFSLRQRWKSNLHLSSGPSEFTVTNRKQTKASRNALYEALQLGTAANFKNTVLSLSKRDR
ncbi:hypothetical protein QQF64_013868 [Cirrhinus molitorella]|uniref:Uncharacterized protein n=1 Tax=Cirrhinus molitorella TaxID=172907 RepID=A0ABR3LVY4_9TELE